MYPCLLISVQPLCILPGENRSHWPRDTGHVLICSCQMLQHTLSFSPTIMEDPHTHSAHKRICDLTHSPLLPLSAKSLLPFLIWVMVTFTHQSFLQGSRTPKHTAFLMWPELESHSLHLLIISWLCPLFSFLEPFSSIELLQPHLDQYYTSLVGISIPLKDSPFKHREYANPG